VRGEPAADVDRLVDVLLRLAALARDFPEVVELDINPFLAAPAGAALALDARARIAAR